MARPEPARMAGRAARRGGGEPAATTITRRAHLALFDATSLTAKGLKDLLVARAFPVASVRLFTSRTDPDANLTEFAGEAMLVTAPDIDALGSLDIAFFCGTEREGALYLEWPARKGFYAIDLSAAATEVPEVPLINAAVNPGAIPGHPGLIATPRAAAQMLSTLLAPIQRRCGLASASAVVFQPASEAGEAGIEELYQQTLGLLNFHDVPKGIFGHQLAFNLVPSWIYPPGAAPGGAGPARVEREVGRTLGGDVPLTVEVILAPVFHCHAVLAQVTLPPGASRDGLLAALGEADGLRVAGAGSTPVEHAGKTGIVVGGVRPAGPSGFWIWAVADDLTAGSGLNAVRIAEALLARGAVGFTA